MLATKGRCVVCFLLMGMLSTVQARYCIKDACILNKMPGYKAQVSVCPPVRMLSRHGMYWGAPGGWTTYNPSFIKHVEHFVAAQWQGVNLGSVMCVYTGGKGRAFPVVLQQMTNAGIAPEPFGVNWNPTKTKGIRNCMAHAKQTLYVSQCSYITVVSPKKNPYQQLQFFNKNGGHKIPNSDVNTPEF